MKAANKNTLREITKTKSRFLSILFICLISVGFFSGVRATCNIMRVSADDYFDEHNLFDLRVLSTFGLTDNDLESIKDINGVNEAYASKYTDLEMHYNDKEYLTRVYSQTPDEINKIDIVSGRAPEADDEAIINCNSFGKDTSLGETVTLEDLTKADEFPLKYKEYKIVGLYNSPMFISKSQRGSTNIGDGALDALMIVSENNFVQEPYTEIYVKSDKLKNMQSYSDEYDKLRDEISDKLTELGEERSEIRYDEVFGDKLAEIADNETEIAKNKSDLEDKKAELENNQSDLDEQRTALLSQSLPEIQKEAALQALDDAQKQIDDGKQQIADGEKKIEDAEKQISDAKQKIADAGKAKWYIFTRDDNPGYSEYNSNAERIDRISLIFPVFFLLVAGLVCLTTMSRMVEEQRTQIGTLKALGYSRGTIMRHYMIYAVTAAVIGGAVGAVGGTFLFPGVIMFAYSMLYRIVDIHFMFTADNLIMSIGSMVLAIALTVYFSCSKALKETPASLMRPKAPKSGKRIFLEKITFIWNKMSFFAKVSARNLIRYKRRMIMTIVGIAGCTALSLTGFGLKNSILDIVDLQFNDIYKYSGYAAYDDEINQTELDSIYETLTDYDKDTEYTCALIKQYDLEFSGNTVQCYITAAEDSELFGKFIDMHDRKTHEPISIKDGAVITEKAAKLLGAKAGDEITVKISDGVNKNVKIAAVTEQYVSHYLYLSENDYKDIFGETPKYNMVYFDNGISRDSDVQAEFTEHMLKNKNISAVIMNASSLNNIYDMLKIMDLVVLVFIVSAAALAFVVLYNLTNVNITERIREIATLKVLGFYDREVSSYVFRESIVLTFVGALAGLGLGYALCMFVINTAEIDELMFGRSIHGTSYLLAFAVTAAFSLIVNLVMTKVLKKVSMVESLKSVE